MLLFTKELINVTLEDFWDVYIALLYGPVPLGVYHASAV